MSSRIKIILPFGLLVFFVLLYIHNLSRSVYGGDVGDLVSAAYVFGVPHPPGYPLFTLLGFLFSRLSFSTPAFMVGLVPALFSALGVVVFYFLSLRITKNILISLASSLILGFSFLYWFYAEIAEVFALNNFFAILLFFLGLLLYQTKDKKYFYLLSLFAGLSITNHHTIILIFPSLFILSFPFIRKNIKNVKLIITSLLLFLLGFSVYIYVFIASSTNPPVNWDNVQDIDSFLQLFLRRDYGTFNAGIFAPPNLDQRVLILKNYFTTLLIQLTIPVIVISLFGIVELFKKQKLVLFSLLLAFVLSGPLFIGYAGFPLQGSFFIGIYERFFVLSTIFILILFPAGLYLIFNIFKKYFRYELATVLILAFFLIPLQLFYYNFPKTNLSNLWIGDNLAHDLISPLPKNAAILLSGDTMLFNSWYYKYALGNRKDVQIINMYGIERDEYLDEKKKEYINKYPESKDDLDLPIKVIKELNKTRPVFSFEQFQPRNDTKIIWVPYGIIYKLYEDRGRIPSREEFVKNNLSVWENLKTPKARDRANLTLGSLSIADLPSVYANSLLATGNFFWSEYNDKEMALSLYKRALEIHPNYSKTHQILGVYYLNEEKNCKKAEASLKEAIHHDPFDRISYYLSYVNYRDCFKNKNMLPFVVSAYKRVFGVDFFDDIKKTSERFEEINKK